MTSTPIVGSEIKRERRKQKHCFGKGHIYLGEVPGKLFKVVVQIFKPWRWGKAQGRQQPGAQTEKRKISMSRRRHSHLAKCGKKNV